MSSYAGGELVFVLVLVLDLNLPYTRIRIASITMLVCMFVCMWLYMHDDALYFVLLLCSEVVSIATMFEYMVFSINREILIS